MNATTYGPYPDPTLGITVHYTELSDGTTQTQVEYGLTPEERNAQAYPDNVNAWKSAKASALGMTLEEYDAAVSAQAASAPYTAKGERMEAARQRLIGEFRAYNGGRIASGEVTAEQVREFRKSTQAKEVLDSLRALDFLGAIDEINAMTEDLATQAFKDHWVAKITAEL